MGCRHVGDVSGDKEACDCLCGHTIFRQIANVISS